MLDAWFDLAFGGSCGCCGRPGRLLCPRCRPVLPRAGFPVRPDPEPAGLAPAFAAGWYADPLRPLLLAHKEHRAFGLARPLGEILAAVVRSAVGQPDPDSILVLVPVPSNRAVVRQRGHDPVLRMCAAAARVLRRHGYRCACRTLLRQRERAQDQADLGAADRAANLAGLLLVADRDLRRLARAGVPVRLVLCDDILTTGSTAREAQRALTAVGLAPRAITVIAATRKQRPTSRRIAPKSS